MGSFFVGAPPRGVESLLPRQIFRGLMDGVSSVELATIELVQSRYGAKCRQLRFFWAGAQRLCTGYFTQCKVVGRLSAKCLLSSKNEPPTLHYLPQTGPRGPDQ